MMNRLKGMPTRKDRSVPSSVAAVRFASSMIPFSLTVIPDRRKIIQMRILAFCLFKLPAECAEVLRFASQLDLVYTKLMDQRYFVFRRFSERSSWSRVSSSAFSASRLSLGSVGWNPFLFPSSTPLFFRQPSQITLRDCHLYWLTGFIVKHGGGHPDVQQVSVFGSSSGSE
jgi:hypothetical protein